MHSAGCSPRNFCLPKLHLFALVAKPRKILVTPVYTLQIPERQKGPLLLSFLWQRDSSGTAMGFLQHSCSNDIQVKLQGCKAWADCKLFCLSAYICTAQWRVGQKGWPDQRSTWLHIPPLTVTRVGCSKKDRKYWACKE